MNKEDLSDVMTTAEAAKYLRISIPTLCKWGRIKKIPYSIINKRGDRRYLKKDVLALIGL